MDRDWRSEKTLQHRSFRLVDLLSGGEAIVGRTFEDCTIYGPAVIILLGDTEFAHNQINGDPSAVLWEIPEDREMVVGAVGLVNCTVRRCVFQGIGLAGKHDFLDAFMSAMSNPSEEGTQ